MPETYHKAEVVPAGCAIGWKIVKVEILPPANWVAVAAPVQQHPGGFFLLSNLLLIIGLRPHCGNHSDQN